MFKIIASWPVVYLRARSQFPVYGLTGRALGGRAAGRRRQEQDFAGKILE